jgi:hypothetical protein
MEVGGVKNYIILIIIWRQWAAAPIQMAAT